MENAAREIQEFIKAAREGDLVAFEKIVLLFERKIFAHLFRLMGRREDAEDLTQEVFIKVFKKIKSVDLEQSFNAWIYTVATNTAYDFLRSRQSGRSDLLIISDPESGFETIDPSDTYEIMATSGDVEQALGKLRPVQKSVLLLYYKEGLSYDEIAAALGAPVGTVKTNIYRAKAELKKQLPEYGKNRPNN